MFSLVLLGLDKFADSSGNVYRSTNGGNSWQKSSEGLPQNSNRFMKFTMYKIQRSKMLFYWEVIMEITVIPVQMMFLVSTEVSMMDRVGMKFLLTNRLKTFQIYVKAMVLFYRYRYWSVCVNEWWCNLDFAHRCH